MLNKASWDKDENDLILLSIPFFSKVLTLTFFIHKCKHYSSSNAIFRKCTLVLLILICRHLTVVRLLVLE